MRISLGLGKMRQLTAAAAVLLILFTLSASAENVFPQYGNASWYGNSFHGRKTASGQIFDQNALTGANRTLPFGSVVRVTNLRNGRYVDITINDRGPFIKTRIIDISRAAAREIGILHRGVARVRVSLIYMP